MSHALEQMKAAGIGVICQSSSSKLPTSCLHGYSASLHKLHGSTFFWEAIFVTPTIVLARTIHTLAWKIRVEKCHLSFWYGILPGSFRFQTWCGDFQFRGCISTRTLSSNQSNSHDVNTAKNARSSKKGWESWSSTFQSCFSMFQIKRRVVGLYRAFSNRPWYYQFGYRM